MTEPAVTRVALLGPKPLHTGTWIAEYEPWIAPIAGVRPPEIVAVMSAPSDSITITTIAEESATRDRGNFATLISALLNTGL